jgi:hypothetical protein
MQSGQVLSDREIEFMHNSLVERWREAGYSSEQIRDDQKLRGAFIENFARSVEAAVIGRIAPEMLGGTQ